jgi:hypothetical protein
MSRLPRKVKKALVKWKGDQPLGLQERKRVQALLSRTRLSRKLKKLVRGNGTHQALPLPGCAGERLATEQLHMQKASDHQSAAASLEPVGCDMAAAGLEVGQ